MKGRPGAVPSLPLSMGSHRAVGLPGLEEGDHPEDPEERVGQAVGEGDEQEQSMRFGYGDAITRPINYCVY